MKYEDDMNIEFATHALASCTNPDAVLAALDHDLQEFKDYRDRKEGLRKWLKPILHLIGSLSEAAGETVGVVPVPFARAGFISLGVLVQAAKNVSARYDCIIDLCELLHSLLERLRVYISAQLPDGGSGIVIWILAHRLSVFAFMTKEIKHTRIGTYLRTLIGRTDVQNALKKLNDLIGAEQSMGVASAMICSREILDHVHGLVLADKDALAQLENNLQKAMQTMEGT
ncbi:hypothetical protein B0H13DRAFT_2549510 [Mycena leptocephala]|nr:hypothetical protein B0H13DRAFT_2549510 [Mycena leptocephala]